MPQTAVVAARADSVDRATIGRLLFPRRVGRGCLRRVATKTAVDGTAAAPVGAARAVAASPARCGRRYRSTRDVAAAQPAAGRLVASQSAVAIDSARSLGARHIAI